LLKESFSEYCRDDMIFLIYVFAGLAAFLFGWTLFSLNRGLRRESEPALRDAGFGADDEDLPGFFRMLLPWARLTVPARMRSPASSGASGIAKEAGGWGWRGWLAMQIRYAGDPAQLAPEELLALMGLTGLCAGVGGIFLASLVPLGRWVLLVVCALALVGAAFPLLWVTDRVRHRCRSIRKGLPYALDLMTLGVESGLDFTVALDRLVARLGPTPLSREFGRLLYEIQMGRTRREALEGLRERTPVEEVGLFVGALNQADQVGAGLGRVLRIQTEVMRRRRFQRAEELAMKVPVKIIFPLILFIMPTSLAVIFGPIAIQLWQQFGS
jgi:tight adherence protein C